MIIHDASWGMIHGRSANMSWGVGVKNRTSRVVPDMLGGKMGTKRVPVRALKVPTISKSTVFRGEAIREDGRSPGPLFWVEMSDFRVDFLGRFLVDFWGAPNKSETPSLG